MKILLVEDSRRLQHSIGTGLRKAGYAVDVTGDGEEGLFLIETNEYDAVILDLMLPGVDGLTILRKLRSQGNDTHILILTARDTIDDRVRGLGLGADDYLVKPFAFEELLARIQALIRRKYKTKSPLIRIGALEIDTAAKVATSNGEEIKLTAREYSLLEYLAARRGKVVTRTELEEHIYDERLSPMSNVVDSAVCKLRKKISQSGRPNLIHTRRGIGYIMEEARK
jgi:DNA-binding response OmpR family regulator